MSARLLFFVISLLVLPLAAAQTKYIDDTLYLDFYKTSDGSGEQFTSAPSGSAVTLLETEGEFSLVRTEKGTEGWVQSRYLVDTPPAVLRIKALEGIASQVESLIKKVESLTKENNYLREEIDKLLLKPAIQESVAMDDKGETVRTLSARNVAQEYYLERFQTAIDEAIQTLANAQYTTTTVESLGVAQTQATEAAPRGEHPMDFKSLIQRQALLAMLKNANPLHYVLFGVALLIGFILGIVVLDRRIRARHNGYRIW